MANSRGLFLNPTLAARLRDAVTATHAPQQDPKIKPALDYLLGILRHPDLVEYFGGDHSGGHTGPLTFLPPYKTG